MVKKKTKENHKTGWGGGGENNNISTFFCRKILLIDAVRS